ncbi:MAG: DUF3429 family protein [Betaproteobacteria bacterium]|nr:DUF3429 family protein [Betaproteobacteria bacterium]
MSLVRWRAVLGYGGLVPFVSLALLVWILPKPLASFLVMMQLVYGAMILCFVGAVHWGRSLAPDAGRIGAGTLVWSVLPSLWACLALLLSYANRLGLAMIAAGLVLAWVLDRFVLFRQTPDADWLPAFLRLRTRLTAVAVLSLLATLASPASA